MSGRSRNRGALGAKSWPPAALLAASVLSFSLPLTRAQNETTTITAEPQKLIEGDSVTLTPSSGVPENSSNCRWYRGRASVINIILIYYLPPASGHTKGQNYTGKETLYPDCSLRITNLKVNDSGTYIIRIEGPTVLEKGMVDIVVLGRGVSAAAIVGIIVGSMVALVVLILVIYFVFRSSRHGDGRFSPICTRTL